MIEFFSNKDNWALIIAGIVILFIIAFQWKHFLCTKDIIEQLFNFFPDSDTLKVRKFHISTATIASDSKLKSFLQDPKDEEYYEYLNDPNNMQPVDSSKTLVSKEEPGPSDRWISKKTYREEVFGEWPTTAIFKEYYYDDYVKATVDWNFTDLLGEKLKDAKPAEIVYHEYWTEEPAEWSGLKFTNINSEFSYKKGIVKIYQSISMDGTGEVFRMLTDKGRVLTYVSKSGNEYTLVENASWMLVDFMLGEEMVQLEFYNLSDQQIYDFLDKLNVH